LFLCARIPHVTGLIRSQSRIDATDGVDLVNPLEGLQRLQMAWRGFGLLKCIDHLVHLIYISAQCKAVLCVVLCAMHAIPAGIEPFGNFLKTVSRWHGRSDLVESDGITVVEHASAPREAIERDLVLIFCSMCQVDMVALAEFFPHVVGDLIGLPEKNNNSRLECLQEATP